MSYEPKPFDSERLSGIAYRLNNGIDNTAWTCIASTGLDTGGAANTASVITDVSKFAENTLYINSTGGPATNGGTTGLTIFFEARPASSVGWAVFRTETGVEVSGLSIIRVVGSGLAATSGATHFKDIRITIENTTDSSGTATVQAWLLQRTPL